MTATRPHPALPRPLPTSAGAPDASTWSTRSAASMNDVDTDQRRRTLADEEGPDHRHNADDRAVGWHRSAELRRDRAVFSPTRRQGQLPGATDWAAPVPRAQ